jgi:hypothetical protein
LAAIDVRPLDEKLGRAAGGLLAATAMSSAQGRISSTWQPVAPMSAAMSDVVDAALALLAHDGDEIVTIDRDDMAALIGATGCHVELIRP